jgi:hypothetical protein
MNRVNLASPKMKCSDSICLSRFFASFIEVSTHRAAASSLGSYSPKGRDELQLILIAVCRSCRALNIIYLRCEIMLRLGHF